MYIERLRKRPLEGQLLAAGFGKDELGNGSDSPWKACQSGDLSAVKLLLEAGCDKDRVDRDGKTLLYIASQSGKLEIAKLLLEAGCDKDRAN